MQLSRPGRQSTVTRTTGRRNRTRRGAIIVLFAVLLVGVMAMLAFAIDLGYILTSRTDIQRSVDCGALAGAGMLVDGEDAAIAAVHSYVQANRVTGSPVETEQIEIETGSWDETTRTLVPATSYPSAVRVVARMQNRQLFFASILGSNTFDIEAEAIAVYQPRDIMIVLDYSGSMNDDSELKSIGNLGRAAIEANLLEIYQELGSPTYGSMQYTPQYISTTNTNRIKRALGLNGVPYPYPGGSWDEYIQYVKTDNDVSSAGYRKKYGYLTLVNYWLEKREAYNETPDLWQTSEQPITAVKDAVRVFLAYVQEVDTADRVGLSTYTSAGGDAVLETGLTENMQLVEDISRQRQAGHYQSMTNIGAGLHEARLELDNNARPGALKLIILMTDGMANRPSGNANGYLLQEAQLCQDAGYPVVTVSLGAGADTSIMQQVADITGGVHFNIPGGQTVAEYEEDLKDVFREIAKDRPLKLVN